MQQFEYPHYYWLKEDVNTTYILIDKLGRKNLGDKVIELLCFLCQRSGNRRREIKITKKYISNGTGISDKSIQRYMKRLQSAGLIKISRTKYRNDTHTIKEGFEYGKAVKFGTETFITPLCSAWKNTKGVYIYANRLEWEKWNSSYKSRGGRRCGAGRKKRSISVIKVSSMLQGNTISYSCDFNKLSHMIINQSVHLIRQVLFLIFLIRIRNRQAVPPSGFFESIITNKGPPLAVAHCTYFPQNEVLNER